MAKSHEIKSTLAITLPLIAAFLAQKGMQLIDTMMMGWLGPIALAAGAKGIWYGINLGICSLGIALMWRLGLMLRRMWARQ